MEEMVDVRELSEAQLQELMERLLSGQTTIQETKGLSDEQMEAIYSIAFNCYSAGKYQEASEVFTWLSMCNPFQGKYWLGLGASLQMTGKFEPAQYAYAMSAVTGQPGDPVPHLYAAECCLAQGQKDDARKALKMAADFAEGRPEHVKTCTRAKALLTILEEKNA